MNAKQLILLFIHLFWIANGQTIETIQTIQTIQKIQSTSTTLLQNLGGLEFVGQPTLFQPIQVQFSNPILVDFSQLVYLDLESRPLDVLPGREDVEWRRILTKSAPPGVNVEFGCEWVTATGLYRIRGWNGNQTLESSVVQLSKAKLKDAPKLQLREDSIFPHCQHDFDLSWQLPNCTLERRAAADTFRIRVSAVQSDGMEIYMGELRPAPELPSRVAIPCAQFDIIYVEFCFELVSLQPYSHQLDVWDRRCLSTEPVLRIDGGWSNWSQWSDCSKSCGNGRRKRKRECNNPKTQKGRFCVGKMIETEKCSDGECTTVNFLEIPLRLNFTKKFSCECGCTLNESSGAIFVGQNLNCMNKSMEWQIPARYLARLRLVFMGKLSDEDKLAVLDVNGEEMFNLNGHVKSSPSMAIFPLDTQVTILLTSLDKIEENGVIIDYEIIPAPQPSKDGNEYSALIGSRFVECQSKMCHSMMIILSLLVCLVTIMILVSVPPILCSFITRKRMRSRKSRASNLLESMRAESEMVRSGGTDSTQLSSNHSASKPPVPPTRENGTLANDSSNHNAQQFTNKRSIGVQQSAQTTPRQLRSALETPRPNPSMASVDLEYDYYDPIVPGSMLRPLEGDIDIEGIIATETSGWLSDPIQR